MTNDMKYYECVICKQLNHASRFHCQSCGTIPAMYSFFRVPLRGSQNGYQASIPVACARGIDRNDVHFSRVFMRTVPFDYYAEI